MSEAEAIKRILEAMNRKHGEQTGGHLTIQQSGNYWQCHLGLGEGGGARQLAAAKPDRADAIIQLAGLIE